MSFTHFVEAAMSFDQSDAPSASKRVPRVFPSVATGCLVDFVRSPIFLSGVIAAVTLLTFARVLNADFVMWDDDWCIYNNPNLGGLSFRNLYLLFADAIVSSGGYTPLNGLRWCFTYQFCKLNPFGYHLGNWLFHGANAVLVFLVLQKLLVLGLSGQGRIPVDRWRITVSAALAALLWSLHPLRVAPVAWAAAGGYDQMLLFLLISLLRYLLANETAKTTTSRRLYLSFSLASFVASMLSQPFGLSFIVVFFVLDIYPLRRLGGSRGWWRTATARRAILEKIPFVAAILVVLFVNLSILAHSARGGHRPVLLAEFGLFERLMQAMYVWAYYAWRPWYPVNLSPVYTTFVQFNPLSLPFVASGLAVTGATIALVLVRRRWPLALALGICHLVLLFPVLGLTEYPHHHVDRYSLIVSISWSVLLAAFLASPKTRSFSRSIVLAFSIVAITALGLLSFRQTKVWNNSVTLFKYMIRTLGDDPYRNDIHWRLGIVLVRQGNTEQAIKHFQRTLEIIPNHPIAQYQLGAALQLHVNRGTELASQGKLDEAVKYFNAVLAAKPDWPETHYNLGCVYYLQEKIDLAVEQCTEALRLKPDYLSARIMLARTLVELGKIQPAVEHYYRILQSEPNQVSVLKNLAWILAAAEDVKLRNPVDAVKFAERACELTNYKQPGMLDTLAVAYAAVGRFAEAVETAEKALEFALSAGEKDSADEIQKRLQLYKAGQPYRWPSPKASSD